MTFFQLLNIHQYRSYIGDKVEETKLQRFNLLNKIYELSHANAHLDISCRNLGIDENLSPDKNPVLVYLEKEGLIEVPLWIPSLAGGFHMDGVRITHEGIKEVERARENPGAATNHFPANIVNIWGKLYNSPFQVAGNNSTFVSTISQTRIQDLRELIGELEKFLKIASLEKQTNDELKAEIETIRSQLSSPKPKVTIINEALSSAKTILGNVSTVIAAAAPIISKISGWLMGTPIDTGWM